VGAQPENVLTMSIALPARKYSTLEQQATFYQQLLDRVKNTPGVQAASVSGAIPLEHIMNGYISGAGQENPALDQTLVEFNYISTDYFRTFGIPFVKGRDFSDQDFKDTAEAVLKIDALWKSHNLEATRDIRKVTVINQTMGRKFWPQQDPVGRTFTRGDNGQYTVIGVVGDVNERGVRRPVIPQAYYPLPEALNEPGLPMRLAIRSAGGARAVLPTVRAKVRALDSGLALSNVRTMEDVITTSITMAGTSYQTLLLGSFALLALVLTAVGIYGVMAYAVSQRRHEIGLRIALGAPRSSILVLVISQGAKLTLAGVAIGLVGAYALTRLMSSLVYGIRTTDPVTFAAVAGLLTAVALLACYVPARRATKVDPMQALRCE